MRLMPLTLALVVIALSGAGPALAEDTCNGSNDPCKVGDCVGGDMLGKDRLWSPNSACKVSVAPGGPGRLASGASGGGAADSGPAPGIKIPDISTSTGLTFPGPDQASSLPVMPGGCILRPGNPLGCGTGESPNSFMIGGANTVAKCLMIGGTVLNAGRLSRCKVPMSSAR